MKRIVKIIEDEKIIRKFSRANKLLSKDPCWATVLKGQKMYLALIGNAADLSHQYCAKLCNGRLLIIDDGELEVFKEDRLSRVGAKVAEKIDALDAEV